MLACHLPCPCAALVRPLVRIEVRRPAAWLALAAGACAAVSDHPVPAAASAALAAVAAIGEMPIATRTTLGTTLLAVRAAWPAAGFLIVAAVRSSVAVGSVAAAASAATSLIATVVMLGALQTRVTPAADAASLALVIAATAIAAARAGQCAGILPLAAGGGAWLALAVAAAAYAQWSDGGGLDAASPPRTSGTSLSRGVLPGGGPMRRLLGAAAMATTLAAMVAWLVLDPARAAWAFELAIAWFVCLAVPAALMQDGDAARAAWRPVFLSAARDPARGRGSRLGPVRFATEVAMGHAAVLGWPAVVAAAVGMTAPGGMWPGLEIAAAMVAAAAMLAILAFLCFGRGCAEQPGETALAIAMVLLVAVLRLAPLPIFVWRPEADVEQFAASCQTPHVMQAVRRPPIQGEFPCSDAN